MNMGTLQNRGWNDERLRSTTKPTGRGAGSIENRTMTKRGATLVPETMTAGFHKTSHLQRGR
jgi:hypothetical protein